jgi:hypothetical protein
MAGAGAEAILIDGAELAALKRSVALEDRVVFGNTVLLNFWSLGFSTRRGTEAPWGTCFALGFGERPVAFLKRLRNGIFIGDFRFETTGSPRDESVRPTGGLEAHSTVGQGGLELPMAGAFSDL